MARSNEALEAYRKARAEGQDPSSLSLRAVTSPPPQSTPRTPLPPDTDNSESTPFIVTPVTLQAITAADQNKTAPSPTHPSPQTLNTETGARNLDLWITEDRIEKLVEAYPFLPKQAQRQKILTWAFDKAKTGNLKPLLDIGLEDIDRTVQRHLQQLLDDLKVETLVPQLTTETYTPRQQCTIALLLGRAKSPEAGQHLSKLAASRDSRIRQCAIAGLTSFPVNPALQYPIFKKHIEETETREVRLAAAKGLARVATPEAIALIEQAAKQFPDIPEMQGIIAAYNAKYRVQIDDTVVKKKKKEPLNLPIGKIIFIIALFGFAGFKFYAMFAK